MENNPCEEIKVDDVTTIMQRLEDIQKEINYILNMIGKNQRISFYKIIKKVNKDDSNNNVKKESLNLVVTLNKIVEIIKEVEEVSDLLC